MSAQRVLHCAPAVPLRWRTAGGRRPAQSRRRTGVQSHGEVAGESAGGGGQYVSDDDDDDDGVDTD